MFDGVMLLAEDKGVWLPIVYSHDYYFRRP